MVAGMRLFVRLHTITADDDDDVGGALITGTATYLRLPATINYHKPSRMLLEQGVEVKRMADIMVQPGRLAVYEGDEWEIVGPDGHEDVGVRFGIDSVARTGLGPNDGRGRFLVCTCTRHEPGRGTQDGRQI